ncbi:hypothetical protein L8P05_18920 [Enterobacter cloacae]|uniref:hypothetical protein n=1 Tax=Enterobacter cloacae TaxID=550 RepID=UPI002005C1FE|nr:hypothetical protein [Enterobacter cloacae]MCK7175996.1 hypothetical protein [Enterobacter cloacae]
MMIIEWQLSYESGSVYPWVMTGWTSGGNLWAEYVFATKPTKRQMRRTRKGKGDAVINVYFDLAA